MDRSRRNFCLGAGAATIGAATVAAMPAAAAPSAAPLRRDGNPAHRWAMVVDVRKCVGCQACTVACIMENDVPENSFRTIVSTYEVTEQGKAGSYMLPRLCNHCEDPPCIPVCPTGATFQRRDGIVVVDNTVCVGCAYCVQACPYDARFINHETQTADKCTFCVHRVEAGLLPACVETCVGGARIFGDLNDPDSAVATLVREENPKVLKPEQGTQPRVFYLGLDPRFQGKVDGTPTLWRPSRETHAQKEHA
ncbi:tetrathionate reductase subunit B (plasmid) [Azospirillum baldaniorum]|uniref:Fe-S-cluster-containing hydrogenase components 1 n=1 Tax=Azospirillum baldaniorum TaxID=1064539 RepID=A0A9P1JXI2_9PROT|nr:4Fe-4S dicluster domain-containing protein [Azospirillum baldaniorum]AWJ93591.1 tetrathionate reductase subunit B [Azospirillum baldaniorum]TWA82135.1 tetrathionate reductase beta subunit [Azospirillum brasilense]CCD01638.1 Fe-S-cluster-containing hydrogenase components 1 [Azospirillum baldaniorum]